MQLHELKIEIKYFVEIEFGFKNFEIRYNDRNYQKGDLLLLKEWDGEKFTGKTMVKKITSIFSEFGLQENYVILSIK